MMRALNTAGTGMIAQQINIDVIANNLANVNTTGFKQQRAEFQDLMYQTYSAGGMQNGGTATTPQSVEVGLGTRFAASAASFAQGPMQATNRPLDVAIQGEGFFTVTMPDGTTGYTRDGSFSLDANGNLVTSDGFAVGPGITIPPGTAAVSISPDGRVQGIAQGAEETTELGRLELATFANPAGLTRVGNNLYRPSSASGDAQTGGPGENGAGQLAAGYVEGSNVQIVEEMVRMILAQRAYEINSKAIQTADDMLSTTNNLKR